MSLPSLSSVLRNIGVGLPGSPPGTAKAAAGGPSNRRQQSRAELLAPAPSKGRTGAGGESRRIGETQRPPELEHAPKDYRKQRGLSSTPGSTSSVETPPSSSGGYRRRRHELEIMSDELDSPGSALSGSFSEGSGSTATYAGGTCTDRSVGGWTSSSWDGSDHERWDAVDCDRQRHSTGIAPRSVSPSEGHGATSNAYGTSNSKRPKLEYSRSTSGMSVVGNGTRGRPGFVEKGRVVSANSLVEQGLRHHSQSHSTDEWRAMSKAARVLGVDSLEERDVEDQRRASMTKAARILGVDNAEELQLNVAADRCPMWAPPRSSASKAARMLGVEDVSELQREASRAARGRSFRRKSKLPESGDSGSKPRQGSISSLIRALEHNDISGAEAQRNSEAEKSKQGTGRREQMETASALSVHSNRSTITRATESCSSISDLTLTEGDAGVRGGCGAPGDAEVGAEARHQQRQELLDDQMSGLQTPRNLTASGDGGHGQGFSRHSRDEMEIETPPSQPRSAALTSLRQAPAPLVAPFTPSINALTYRLSPSPIGPGPSPAGSPCTPQIPTTALRHASDLALSSSDGENRPSPMTRAPNEGVDTMVVADGKVASNPARVTVVEEKTRRPMPAREAIGDEEKRNGDGRVGGGDWRRENPAAYSATVVRGGPPRTTQHRAGQEPRYDCQSPSSLPPCATAGQEELSWAPVMRSAPLPTPVAGRKKQPPDRAAISEVKQEPSASPELDGGRWTQTVERATVSAFDGNGNGRAEAKHRGWPSQHASHEFKHESDGLFPRQMGLWGPGGVEQASPVSRSTPLRPESTFSTAYPHEIHYPQPYQHFAQQNREHPDQYQRHQHRLHMAGRSPGASGRTDQGIPLSNAVASDSSGESESICETHPDRMEETEPAPSSAFEALAALIPVVDPLGMTQPAVPGVKAEEDPAGVAALAAAAAVGKAKTRRRPSKCNTWSDEPPVVATTPACTATITGSVPIAHSPVSGAACGAAGISTRKQQEVATRPREKGRFVKRPPAFLPYSAFKRSDESSLDAAAEAAEAAEEAREKAAEAAALAAVAAAAAERRGGSTMAGEGAKSNMSPPSVGASPAVKGLGESSANGCGGGGRIGRGEGRDGTPRKNSSCGAPPLSPSSPATPQRSEIRRPYTPGNGSVAVRRGRAERGTSPMSRAAAAPNDIWSGEEDREREREREKEKDAGRERSMSDCGSERGSDDLRGMAFLPWSPVDGPSPRGSAWDSPRRSLAFSVASGGSAASTPARSRNRLSGSGSVFSQRTGSGDSNGSFGAPSDRA